MWTRSDRLGLIAIVVIIVTLAIGAAAALLIPEARCFFRLDKCPASSNTEGPPAAFPTPSPTDVFVDGPALPGEPTLSRRREPFPISRVTIPLVRIANAHILNRGNPVPIDIQGSGFRPESLVNVGIATPNGSSSSGVTSANVSERGTFDLAWYWWPWPELGIFGNDGAYILTATDEASKQSTKASFVVGSDASTPPPDQWANQDTWQPSSQGRPTLQVETRGSPCGAYGERVLVEIKGLPPDAVLEMSTLREDGIRIQAQGIVADAMGRVQNVIQYFSSSKCDPFRPVTYRELITGPAGLRLTGDIDFR
jgi:hypothetical protein